ncbi:MAG TPA: hypothetical protein VMM13_16445 [Euzebya sp.]|nr:hypothetical protein [Euzebya sp.]
MADNEKAKDFAAAGLGVLALALGGATIMGVVRPPSGVMADNLLTMAVIANVAGIFGLYLGGTRGRGRQIAVLGTAIALIGLALVGGAFAVETLVDDVRTS